jgi:hypothetical protein
MLSPFSVIMTIPYQPFQKEKIKGVFQMPAYAVFENIFQKNNKLVKIAEFLNQTLPSAQQKECRSYLITINE